MRIIIIMVLVLSSMILTSCLCERTRVTKKIEITYSNGDKEVFSYETDFFVKRGETRPVDEIIYFKNGELGFRSTGEVVSANVRSYKEIE